MVVLETVAAGDYRLTPMLSAPHSFWTVTGTQTERVNPDGGPGVHLMLTVWDGDTGTVLPIDAGTSIRLFRDGEAIGSPRTPWAMLSQEMGAHFGDNVPLAEDGTYTVEVTLPALDVRRTGAFAGRFDTTETASVTFEYDAQFRQTVVDGIEYLDEALWGDRGALEPTDHSEGDHATLPSTGLPPADAYPGTSLGEPESGDAAFVTRLLAAGSRFVDGDQQYLLVSPRTPYNRLPLADMSLSLSVDGDTDRLPLEQVLDYELGLHYGTAVDGIDVGDQLQITVETPPQVARHQGYETAFLEMPAIELGGDE